MKSRSSSVSRKAFLRYEHEAANVLAKGDAKPPATPTEFWGSCTFWSVVDTNGIKFICLWHIKVAKNCGFAWSLYAPVFVKGGLVELWGGVHIRDHVQQEQRDFSHLVTGLSGTAGSATGPLTKAKDRLWPLTH